MDDNKKAVQTVARALARAVFAASTHWVDRDELLDSVSRESGCDRVFVTDVLLSLTSNAPVGSKSLGFEDVGSDMFVQWGERVFLKFRDPNESAAAIEIDTNDSPPDVALAAERAESVSGWVFRERDIQQWLAGHLDQIETGLELVAREFPAGGRFIDILARDRAGALVAIEVKVAVPHDRAVGQLLRYVNWLRENAVTTGQGVRGLLVVRDVSEDLRLACMGSVELYKLRLRPGADIARVPLY